MFPALFMPNTGVHALEETISFPYKFACEKGWDMVGGILVNLSLSSFISINFPLAIHQFPLCFGALLLS